jgi:hypothetical protein
MKLHELHQRRLEATVGLIENGLDRMERLLAEDGQGGIVRAVEDTLSPQERSSLLDDFRRLRNELHNVAKLFALQRHPIGIRQVLNAELSSAWVMLENCRPKRMKGFGVEFDPVVRAALDEGVEKLVTQVLALRAKLQ